MIVKWSSKSSSLKLASLFLGLSLVLGCADFKAAQNLSGDMSPDPADQTPLADVQTLSISDDLDDGEIWEGYAPGDQYLPNGETNLDDVYMGYYNPFPVYSFQRFVLTKAIPAGSRMTNVKLTLRGIGDFNWNNSLSLTVPIEDSANASRVTGVDDVPGGLNGRTVLTDKVSWPETGGLTWTLGLNESSDLKSLIQALVDKHGGLAAGAAIQFWIYAPSTIGSESEVTVADYGHADHATALVVEWEK